jgi:chromosome segregation ATPase
MRAKSTVRKLAGVEPGKKGKKKTFDTLIGGVLESNQVLEEVFEDLRWPKNEERRSDPVDMRTINQQRALIMNSKAKLDALSARLATHRAEVKKQKAEEKKEAKRQDKVLAEATKAQAAVPVLQDENKQLKKDSQKFQKLALKAQEKLKQGAKKAKEAERENASLKKQLAALQASQASLSSASSSSIRLPEPTDDGDGDVDWQPSVQTTSSGRRSKPPPSRGG